MTAAEACQCLLTPSAVSLSARTGMNYLQHGFLTSYDVSDTPLALGRALVPGTNLLEHSFSLKDTLGDLRVAEAVNVSSIAVTLLQGAAGEFDTYGMPLPQRSIPVEFTP